jgi:hypothetical protein
LADAFADNNVAFDDALGRPAYVHACIDQPAPGPMIEVTITPEAVEPGWGTSAPRSYVPDNLLREMALSGSVDHRLADDNGNYRGYLNIRVNEVSYSGYHQSPGRPMIHVTNPSVIPGIELTNNNGQFGDVTYIDTCEWGGQYRVTATYIDGSNSYQASDTLAIMFGYLIERTEHESIVDTGRTTFHPENQYIDENVVDMVSEIVRLFYFKIDSAGLGPDHPIIYMNDISVPPGGRFAIDNWQDSNHKEHRQGAHADMYYQGWVYRSEKWSYMLSAIWEATGLRPVYEPHYHYNHFHARFPARYWGP